MNKKTIDSYETVKTLTLREREVFSYLLTKMKPNDIADAIGITMSTFGFHYKNVYKKLQVHSRHELVLRYLRYADRNADTGKKKSVPKRKNQIQESD